MVMLIDPTTGDKLRERKLKRWGRMETERAPWFSHWRDITERIQPRSGRYFVTDRNRGGPDRYNKIIDNTGTLALRTLAAGMMAGASSPARPWFRLVTEDPDMNRFYPVKVWLEDVVDRMLKVFAKSNIYRQLHTHYSELGAFGTSVSVLLEHQRTTIHLYPSPAGEYCLQQDYEGRINTLYRRFERSVDEVVREFGIDNVSPSTRDKYNNHHLEEGVELLHAIEPRKVRDPEMVDRLNMPWESCYLETGGESGKGGETNAQAILRIGGFNEFPVMAARWEVNAGDIYGHSPGMTALGDIRQLKHEQIRKGEVLDYKTNPPLQVPSGMEGRDIERLPGGISTYDQTNPHGGVRALYEVDLDLPPLLEDIAQVQHRIEQAFYADLFLLLSRSPPGRPDLTATEVAIRQEEKLLQLGPVLERLHNELLEVLVDRTFEIMLRNGMLLPPPSDLLGTELAVDFVSILAQAQRQIGINNIDRWVGSVAALAQSKPDILDKLNADEYAEQTAAMLGVHPALVVPANRVRELRNARNNAIAAQQQAEALAMQAKTTKDLAQSPTGARNALTDIRGALVASDN